MLKYIVGIIIFVVLATGAYYVWDFIVRSAPIGTPQAPGVPTMATSTYATSTFSLIHPSDFVVNENYAYEGVPNKPIAGVKFTIPETMATGTNLSSFDTGISVEWLPRAQTCTGDIYVLEDVKPYEITEGAVEYSVATTSSAGAGNFYEEQVYALVSSSPCTAVRYFIHSSNIGNYLPAEASAQAGDPGTIRAFDRSALLRAFDAIRRSLILTAPSI